MNEKSIFESLSELDMTGSHKKKNNITYLPWSAAWAAVKRRYPKATYKVMKDENENLYHTDGKTCWVEVAVHIEDETQVETLAVMDHRNQAISAENVTSTQVNNSIKRCMVKCLALFGLDLNLWEGEELSSAAKEAKEKENEAQKQLANTKKSIVEKCKSLISSGKDKDEIYAIIETISGDKNPNSIKTQEVADEVLKALEGVKA